jgi:DNA repair protein RadD
MIPRWYQTAANDAAWHYLATQPGNPLVVLPTGAGKSLVIAMLAKQAIEFGAQVIVLQHRKELIQQNAEKIRILLPEIPVGIYSAGLNSKQTQQPILCAGIQSVYRQAAQIGERQLIIIDEAHLVSAAEESMYGQFLADVIELNPTARVTGLTATPFRTGEGPICGKKKLFQRICFEAFTGDLIKEGFLCEITNKPSEQVIDTSSLKLRGGEFVESDLQRIFGGADTVLTACQEIVEKCHDRKSILVFCSGVLHAENVADFLRTLTGEQTAVITGETLPIERAAYISQFRSGELRWLVNCDVLCVGFDAPCIDAIAILRATMSPGLFAQMVGRGLRKHESKTNALILDFGNNIERHGSLDDRNYGRARGSKPGSAQPQERNGRGRECLNCKLDVPAGEPECPECGFRFPGRHQANADTDSQLTGEVPPETWLVESCKWGTHYKKNDPEAPPTLRIDYECQPVDVPSGNLTAKHVSEWVCLEHQNFARVKACLWWEQHSLSEVPETIAEAIDLLDRGACRMPSKITTVKDGKYTRIKSVEFVDEMPEEWLEETQPEQAETLVNDFGDEVPF